MYKILAFLACFVTEIAMKKEEGGGGEAEEVLRGKKRTPSPTWNTALYEVTDKTSGSTSQTQGSRINL